MFVLDEVGLRLCPLMSCFLLSLGLSLLFYVYLDVFNQVSRCLSVSFSSLIYKDATHLSLSRFCLHLLFKQKVITAITVVLRKQAPLTHSGGVSLWD